MQKEQPPSFYPGPLFLSNLVRFKQSLVDHLLARLLLLNNFDGMLRLSIYDTPSNEGTTYHFDIGVLMKRNCDNGVGEEFAFVALVTTTMKLVDASGNQELFLRVASREEYCRDMSYLNLDGVLEKCYKYNYVQPTTGAADPNTADGARVLTAVTLDDLLTLPFNTSDWASLTRLLSNRPDNGWPYKVMTDQETLDLIDPVTVPDDDNTPKDLSKDLARRVYTVMNPTEPSRLLQLDVVVVRPDDLLEKFQTNGVPVPLGSIESPLLNSSSAVYHSNKSQDNITDATIKRPEAAPDTDFVAGAGNDDLLLVLLKRFLDNTTKYKFLVDVPPYPGNAFRFPQRYYHFQNRDFHANAPDDVLTDILVALKELAKHRFAQALMESLKIITPAGMVLTGHTLTYECAFAATTFNKPLIKDANFSTVICSLSPAALSKMTKNLAHVELQALIDSRRLEFALVLPNGDLLPFTDMVELDGLMGGRAAGQGYARAGR